MTFKAITTVAALNALDQDQIVAGYRAGMRNEPDYTQRDQGYWHGYMNGQVDTRRMPISPEQQQLCQAVIDSGEFKNMFAERH
ncbi:hypothetical protein [Acidovorax radicis]|uniref:hypothetical protein n=1 Tax=Acidovorax radicis TaxID=758826 RepID=UPI001CFC3D4F|nr:hypothetical protein [Acidovorax radicis]UCV00275.1 hypothetical protein KI609_05675 [Acidovorax radicis]